MKFFTVRDLRTQPKHIWEKLAEVHELVITHNGKPSALMIEIDDENMEEVITGVRQFMAMRATNELRFNALKDGRSGMTDEEIDAEIAEVRKGRKK